jgi:hypothetical protein
MKRYYDLTQEEKLALAGQEIHDAIKLEAVHRGIKPPITLDGIINQHGFQGYTTPPDSVIFYEIQTVFKYGSVQGTGVAYRTESEAMRAIEGGIIIEEEGYGAEKQKKVVPASLSVKVVPISLTKPKNFWSTLEEYGQPDDDASFEALSKEIQVELNTLWQERYNKQVRSEKRKEYLRLANGDEAIAKAFWSKTESGEFPIE